MRQLSFHQSSIEGTFFFSFASEETPALPLVSAESTKTKGQDENKTSKLVAPKGKKKKDGKDEIQIEVTAKLGGIDVTVTSVEGDLTHVIIGGEEFFYLSFNTVLQKARGCLHLSRLNHHNFVMLKWDVANSPLSFHYF